MKMDELANDLKSGEISLSEWQASMRDVVLAELTAAMILARNGRENITQSDWGYVGAQAKKQYQFIDGFAAEIAADPAAWLTGNRLNARVALYNQIGYVALEDDLKREKLKGGYTEERRVLTGGAEHCHDTEARGANKKHKAREARPGCVELSKLEWQPIGTLPPIGDASCWSNCRCIFQYRKPDPTNPGGWIYGDK